MKNESSLTNPNKHREVHLNLLSFYRSCTDLQDGPLADWSGEGACYSYCEGKLVRWIPSTGLGNGYIDYINFGNDEFLVVCNVRMLETTSLLQTGINRLRLGIKISGMSETGDAPILNTDEDNLIFVGGQSGAGHTKVIFPRNKEIQYIAFLLPLSRHSELLDLYTDKLCDELNEALVELQDNQFFYTIHRATTNTRKCAREIIGTEYSNNAKYNYYIAKAQELLCHFEACLESEANTKQLPYKLTHDDRIRLEQIHNMIQTQFDKHFSLSLLSQKAGMSVNRLSLLYKYLYGETIHESMLNARMGKARELLTKTRLTIKEISTSIGYKDPSGFSRAYFKHCGHLPSKNRDL